MTTLAMRFVGVVLLVGACASSSGNTDRLGAALAQAQISLRDSVGVALARTSGAGLQAKLSLAAEPVFSVAALARGSRHDVRVDIRSSAVLSVTAGGSATDPCPGSIALADAISIAETAGAGEAVAIAPDDDDACASEVQVLSGGTLWEVKVGGDGSVLEKEVSDEG